MTVDRSADEAPTVANDDAIANLHLAEMTLEEKATLLTGDSAWTTAASRWASLTLLCSGPQGRPGLTDLTDTIGVLSVHSMQEAWDPERDAEARKSGRYAVLKRRWATSDPRSVVTHANHLQTEPSIVDEVHATGLPVHVVYGENDDAWPLAMQDQMARDLDAPVTVIPDAGHSPNEDRPEETAALIAAFWDQIE